MSLVTRCARVGPRNDVSVALFHSSAPVLWKGKRKGAFGLAKDLSPDSPSGSIHVAEPSSKARGKRPAFERDALPHTDPGVAEAPPVPQERNPSFRRRSLARSEQDWNHRRGKWGAASAIPSASPSRFGPRESTSRFGSSVGAPGTSRFGGSGSGGQGGVRENGPAQGGGFRPPTSDQRYAPRRSSFGLRQEDGDGDESLWSSSSRQSEHRQDARTSYSRQDRPNSHRTPPRQTWGLRSSDSDDAGGGSSYSRHSASNWERHSERRPQDTRADRDNITLKVPDDDPELNELITPPQSLKNRNQNQPSSSVSLNSSSDSKAKLKPEPPQKERVKSAPITLFDTPNVLLTRAGLPIVTKADPTTARTTREYSPAMGQNVKQSGSDERGLPTRFTSPPLLPGLLSCVTELLGPMTPPTPIQALSLKWVVEGWEAGSENVPDTTSISTVETKRYKEFLLASETGSGKSIAYLLPMLQALKLSEARRLAAGDTEATSASRRGLNPRALVLAPTHELARQLTTAAKALLHDVKLRVLCASRANTPTRPAKAADDDELRPAGRRSTSARRMKELVGFAADEHGDGAGEFLVTEAQARAAFPVDVVVGTPMKLMEMVRGRGWERGVQFGGGPAAEFERKRALEADAEGAEKEKERGPKRRRGRDSVPGVGTWKASAEMGLAEVEWVVVDEADVLFDSDFQETTRMLLADIAKARGREVPFISLPVGLLSPTPKPEPVPTTSRQKEKEKQAEEKAKAEGKSLVKHTQSAITSLNYPFNFLVTSATIPHSLSAYLNAYHPALQRLVSPNLHRLPKSLKTEYVSWTGGSKNADIERRLRKVWATDAADGLGPLPGSLGDMSKVLIFCNKNNKVDELGTFLDDKGIKNVQLSGRSPNRKRGSNAHLEGFIKPRKGEAKEKRVDDWSASWVADEDADAAKEAPPAATAVATKPKGAPRALVPLLKQDLPPPPVINDPMNVPHVMITTSLLSRGLDFSPNIKYVFIIDEPRNMIDFLHRAGRTARAGANGRVVIFGKTAGRGSQRSKEVKQRIRALVA